MPSKRPQPELSVRLVPKQRFGDCGVAALAGYLSQIYGDVAAVARRVVPDYAKNGMTDDELLRIARRLGYPMRRLKRWSMLDAVGIANIDFTDKSWGHFALLNRGLILDSDTSEAMPVDLYLERERAEIVALLVLK